MVSGGDDIMAWMEERHQAADHILCVVSAAYLTKPYSSWERRAAQWAAATDRPGFALPVFADCITLGCGAQKAAAIFVDGFGCFDRFHWEASLFDLGWEARPNASGTNNLHKTSQLQSAGSVRAGGASFRVRTA